MSNFAGVSFKVKVEDKFFPQVFMDTEGINRYKAEVFLPSRDHVESMYNRQSIVTARRALGSKAIYGYVEVGNYYTLEIPVHAGQLKSFTAVLTGFEPKGGAIHDEGYWADCEWVILSEVAG